MANSIWLILGAAREIGVGIIGDVQIDMIDMQLKILKDVLRRKKGSMTLVP